MPKGIDTAAEYCGIHKIPELTQENDYNPVKWEWVLL